MERHYLALCCVIYYIPRVRALHVIPTFRAPRLSFAVPRTPPPQPRSFSPLSSGGHPAPCIPCLPHAPSLCLLRLHLPVYSNQWRRCRGGSTLRQASCTRETSRLCLLRSPSRGITGLSVLSWCLPCKTVTALTVDFGFPAPLSHSAIPCFFLDSLHESLSLTAYHSRFPSGPEMPFAPPGEADPRAFSSIARLSRHSPGNHLLPLPSQVQATSLYFV